MCKTGVGKLAKHLRFEFPENIRYFYHTFSFVVEVADFNFGETASVDMEYKTFRRRLVDSIREIVQRRPNDDDDGIGDDSSLNYGTLT